MVLIYLTMGDRSAKLLTGVIMSVLCLVISAKLIGDPLTGLNG
jgi:hypothetical protein